jgi:CBS domain-containing protein
MKAIQVRELMVPLADYPTVEESATLYEAVLALEQARQKLDQARSQHRAILVLDKNGQVTGKIAYLDLLQALEPKYGEIEELKYTISSFTPEFIKSQLQKFELWQRPLDDICRKAARIHVKDIMHTPSEAEFITEDATLGEAVHPLIIGRRQSLLVKRGDVVVGILRLSDVVEKVCEMIKACDITSPHS